LGGKWEVHVLTLYHSNGVCPQKVRVCLAEKGVEWESRSVMGLDLRTPDYLKLNPGGYVPTLVHDGRVLTESRVISEYINDAFDGPALRPADPYDRAKASLWSKQIDDSLHPNVYILSCVVLFRDHFASMSPEMQDQALPLDPTKRERTMDLLERGAQSRFVPPALERFAKLTADMERALQQSRWMACDDYSLADIDHTPYFQRLSNIGLESLWTDKPAVQDWWARIQARPSFAEVQTNWMKQEELDRFVHTRAKGQAMFGPLLEAA
jgi:glutathione S-transferase